MPQLNNNFATFVVLLFPRTQRYFIVLISDGVFIFSRLVDRGDVLFTALIEQYFSHVRGFITSSGPGCSGGILCKLLGELWNKMAIAKNPEDSHKTQKHFGKDCLKNVLETFVWKIFWIFLKMFFKKVFLEQYNILEN